MPSIAVRRPGSPSRAPVSLAALILLVAMALAGCTGSSAKHSGSASATASAPTPTAAGSATSSPSGTRTSHRPSVYPTLTPSTRLPESQRTKAPVPLRATGTFGGRVTGEISGIRSVHATAKRPGEIAGPALAVSIRINNHSKNSINLDNAIVNLYYGAAKTPANPMSTAPSKPLKGSLGSSHSASGVYVFTVPKAQQGGRVTIEVSYSPNAPVVVFAGFK